MGLFKSRIWSKKYIDSDIAFVIFTLNIILVRNKHVKLYFITIHTVAYEAGWLTG